MTLHALPTYTTLHCYSTPGERTTVYQIYNLVDEASNRYTDEAGNYYVTIDSVTVPVIHAPETNTLIHAGAT